VKVGEAAFALGVERPAHIGEYLLLDAVAMILASMINRFTGLELKRAADIVRIEIRGSSSTTRRRIRLVFRKTAALVSVDLASARLLQHMRSLRQF